jgi:hypothetical protein
VYQRDLSPWAAKTPSVSGALTRWGGQLLAEAEVLKDKMAA